MDCAFSHVESIALAGATSAFGALQKVPAPSRPISGVAPLRDQTSGYFQRDVEHLPVGGEIVLFNLMIQSCRVERLRARLRRTEL